MNILTLNADDTQARTIVSACKEQQVNEQGTRIDVKHLPLPNLQALPASFVAILPNQEEAAMLVRSLTKRQPRTCLLILSAHASPDLVTPNTIFVGTRSWTQEEHTVLRQSSARYYSTQGLFKDDFHEVVDAIMEQALSSLALHVHIDMDVLDPTAFPDIPSTGTVPGGLSVRELLYIIQRLSLLRNFTTAALTGWNAGDSPTLSKNSIRTIAKCTVELERKEMRERTYVSYE